uniref:Uncharacterized protein n=1 Tax=Sphaerodactylus townsendi TaxID=933632 RepID=A0ACB8FL89_9SAUR
MYEYIYKSFPMHTFLKSCCTKLPFPPGSYGRVGDGGEGEFVRLGDRKNPPPVLKSSKRAVLYAVLKTVSSRDSYRTSIQTAGMPVLHSGVTLLLCLSDSDFIWKLLCVRVF